jgi:hypothetical protein
MDIWPFNIKKKRAIKKAKEDQVDNDIVKL